MELGSFIFLLLTGLFGMYLIYKRSGDDVELENFNKNNTQSK